MPLLPGVKLHRERVNVFDVDFLLGLSLLGGDLLNGCDLAPHFL